MHTYVHVHLYMHVYIDVCLYASVHYCADVCVFITLRFRVITSETDAQTKSRLETLPLSVSDTNKMYVFLKIVQSLKVLC
jgi:hypothetical protein